MAIEFYDPLTGPAAGGPPVGGSGTAGQLAKFIAPSTLGDSIVTELSGKIGINTTSPQRLLDVKAATNVHIAVEQGSSDATAAQIVALNDGAIAVIPMELRASKFNLSNGNVGIGIVTAAQKLDVSGNIQMAGDLLPEATGTRSLGSSSRRFAALFLSSNIDYTSDLVFAVSTVEKARITTAGAISALSFSGSGAGLTSLDAGNISSGTLAVTRGGTGTGTAFSTGSVVFATPGGSYAQNNTKLFWDNSNFRLGIGTIGPTESLYVGNGGNIAVDSNSAIGFGTRAEQLVGDNSTHFLRFDTNNSEKMRLISSGNLGVGTTNPLATLQLNDTGASLNLGGTPTANGSGALRFINSNSVKNWKISTNDTIVGDIEFAPSTAAGGSTWASPVVTMNATGSVLKSFGIVESTTGGFKFPDATVQTTAATGLTLPTRQVLTSGTGATYTTPASVRQLRIRMVGGGGGGGGNTTSSGGTGGTTTFNSINALGGGGGPASSGLFLAGGQSGGGGTGTASIRFNGSAGGSGINNTGGSSGHGGGSGFFGGGARPTIGAGEGGERGAGGSGAGGNANGGAAGGGGGEGAEIIINSPAASYTYTVGAAGTAGTGAPGGGAGGAGLIIVDEYY